MKKDSVFRGIVSGVVAAVFFLVLFFGAHWNFFLCGVLASGVLAATELLVKPVRRIGRISVEGMANAEELLLKMQEAKEDFQKIESSVSQIMDPELKSDAEKLHQTAGNLLSYLEKNPSKISMARRFIDYYQDRASFLLGQYVELQNTQLATDDAQKLKDGTKRAVVILNDAFEKQFQKLMNNELLDMDAEITLIEKTMKMEGLS